MSVHAPAPDGARKAVTLHRLRDMHAAGEKIAMLELAKETLIEVTQAEAFAPIYVRLAYQPA